MSTKVWTEEQVRVPARVLEKRRRIEGRKLMENLAEMSKDEKVRSFEVPTDMLQDMKRIMVVVGFDVEQLYPSLERGTAAKLIELAIMESSIKWTEPTWS